MKHIYVLLMLAAHCAAAQITIQHSHLPNEGDTLITRNATFTSDYNLEDTGADHVWNFSSDLLQPANLNAGVPCYTLDELSFIDQAVFNNPFYEEYNSDFGLGFEQADLGVVTFGESYQVYKNSGDVYGVTGVLTTINDIPLIAQMDDRDVIYNIPLTYGTSGSSDSQLEFDVPTLGFYGLDQTREYECDGWGTINIWDQSFDVVRVRSVVNGSDSIYADFIGNGLSFDRPETITYEWLSTEFIVPILRVTINDGLVTSIQTADILGETSVEDRNKQHRIKTYPNPTTDQVQIWKDESGISKYALYASSGKFIQSGQFEETMILDMQHLPAGNYLLRIDSKSERTHHTLIKQ
jgi:hypothetical protein